jgi:hypothetical protein
MRTSRRGQSFSFDAITAVGLFVVLLIIAILYFYNLNQGGIQQTLSQEAVIISQNLLSPQQQGITDMGELDDKKIVEIMERLLRAGQNNQEVYNQIKLEFGIRDDFCIYIEDEDGNLLMLQVNDGGPRLAPVIFGSSRAYMNTSASSNSIIRCNFPRK